MKTIRRAVIEKGSDSIIKYLRDKFVEGKDDIVEAWAIEIERGTQEYEARGYEYSANDYAY